MNMHIALVSPYPFTHEPGGVKDFILGLKSALEKRGCIVSIIAPGSKESERKGLIDFILGRPFKISTDQTEFRASLSRKKTAKKILKEINSDIIVIHEPFVPSIGHTLISSIAKPARNASASVAGGRKDGIKRPIIIGQFHARREDLSWGLKVIEFVGRHLVRRPKLNIKTILSLSSGYESTISSNLDGRIAVSEATKRFWQKKLPAEYKVIYNGIDTDELSPDGPKVDRWLNPTLPRLRGARIIFFAGRHDQRKGISDLIEAFSLLIKSGMKDVRLKIAGIGEMTDKLRKMAQELGIQKFVDFVGVMPRDELVRAYRTADLVVAPSIAGEGFNRTIIEARSCGTFIVCTDIEGQREAIGKDLFKFMAKPQNPHSLAARIKEILDLPEAEKQDIRKRGREEVKSLFDWENIADEHLNFYKSLLQGQALRS